MKTYMYDMVAKMKKKDAFIMGEAGARLMARI